jgi:hypothetical protein
MRDFRDAKAMARTLRAALAAKGLNITVSQSLALIAEILGTADWTTLAAAIRRDAPSSAKAVSRASVASGEFDPNDFLADSAEPPFSRELGVTLYRALEDAERRGHEYATLEHLLIALIDDADASAAMRACKADLRALKANLVGYLNNELKMLVARPGAGTIPTAAFQRVAQRARRQVQGREVSGKDLLLAMLDERESPAVWLLGEHGVTRHDALNVIPHDKRSLAHRPVVRPVMARRSNRRGKTGGA